MTDQEPLSPITYAGTTLRQLWEELPRIVLADLLFGLFAAPALILLLLGLAAPTVLAAILTAGPAWAAMLALLAATTTARSHAAWPTFIHAYRIHWRASLQLGTWILAPAVAMLITWAPLVQGDTSLWLWGGFFVGALGAALVGALYLYAFPLLVLHQQSAGTAMRNAFVLAGRYPANTLGLLALVVLGLASIITLSLGLTVLWPAVWGLFIVNNCRLVLALETAPDSEPRPNGDG